MRVHAIVADDDEAVRRLVGRWLESRGWTVSFCETGEALLALGRDLKPALIVSDIEMPGPITGIEACTALRLDRPGLAVVLMSGDGPSLAQARQAGFTTALPKPFDLEALLQAL